MPWTFAHPAAVLPFKKIFRKQIYVLALIIGSISPDIGYYVSQFKLAHFCHTPLGIILGCVPLSILILYPLIYLIKYCSIILPEPHHKAVLVLTTLEKINSLFSFSIFIFAIMLGAFTHVLWDSFTHDGGWIVSHNNFLKSEIFKTGNLKIYGYTLMQHLSSFFGSLILLLWYRTWLKKHNMQPLLYFSKEDVWRYKVVAIILLISIIISLPLTYIHTNRFSGNLAISVFVVDFAFVITPVLLCTVFIAATIIRFYKKTTPS